MRKEYDFSKSAKNPYAKYLKKADWFFDFYPENEKELKIIIGANPCKFACPAKLFFRLTGVKYIEDMKRSELVRLWSI